MTRYFKRIINVLNKTHILGFKWLMLFGEVEGILENVQLHKNIIFTNELAKIIKYQMHLSF